MGRDNIEEKLSLKKRGIRNVGFYKRLRVLIYLHSTSTVILLLTDGGTLFDAMQRYAPISERLILTRLKVSPLYALTEKIK